MLIGSAQGTLRPESVPVHGAGALLRRDLLDGTDQKEWAAARPHLLRLDWTPCSFIHAATSFPWCLSWMLPEYHERKRLATDLRAKSFV